MNKLKNTTIKTGTVNEFMAHVKAIMRSADNNESIQPSQTLIFEDPSEMLQFLSATKVKLIHEIRQQPDSI